MSDRQQIADALSTVDGVNGFKFRTKTMNPGDAFPLLETRLRGPARSYEATWRIIVLLPKGEQDASDWMDSHFEELADCFDEIGYVDLIEPGTLATEAGDRDVMILRLRKEAR